jgi:hypothetical protein
MKYYGTLQVAPIAYTENGQAYISGEWVKVATPQTYEWSHEDLDGENGTGRDNATGEMFRDRVATKRKLSFTWPPLSVEATAKLLQSFKDEFIGLRYLDAFSGDYREGIFYAGTRSASCGHKSRWLGISVNFIEK